MSHCDNCLTSAKGQDEAFNKIVTEATEYARKHGQSIAIWEEGRQYFFGEASAAIAAGVVVLRFISKYQ